MQKISNLPTDWKWVTIEDVTLPIDKTQPRENPEDPFIYIDISSIDNSKNKITDPKNYLGKDAPSRARQLIKKGDVLFSTVRTYLKNIALVPEIYDDQIASTGFSVLRAKEFVDSKFLYYYCLTQEFLDPLNNLQRGTSYPAVRDGDVRSQPFPLPPLDEQRNIVSKIEELFSQLDAGVAGLKRAKIELERYRASVLKAAFEGRLVPQDPNDEPAVEVLNRMGKESAIEKSQEEMPINWVWTTLKDVGTIILGQSPPSSTYNFEGIGLPFFQGKAEFGGMYPSIKKWCSEPKKIAKKDDVLISVRAPVGPTNLANQECCIGRGLAAIRAHKNILSKYILYYLRSIEDEWEHKSTGTTFKAITGSVLRNNPIPLPPLQEQYRIVEKIETILSLIDNLALKIDAELDRSDRLRNAILKTAFNGRLLNQHKLQ